MPALMGSMHRTMFEAYRRYFIHFEVSHDLWHVLSG